MSKENDLEKAFSENINRLLATDEVKIDAAAEDDFRTALNFARKMTRLRTTPSPHFKAELKARLLEQLNAQEAEIHAKEKPGWLSRLIPRQLVWQVVVASLFIVMIGSIIWSTGIFKPTATPGTVSTAGMLLKVQAETDKTSYYRGEEIRIEVVLKNITSEPFTIEQFPPILSLMQADSRQPVYTFAAGKAARTIAPEEEVEFVVTWNQRDDKGKYVPGGGYYVELEDLDYQNRDQAIKLNLVRPVHFNILPLTSNSGRIQGSRS